MPGNAAGFLAALPAVLGLCGFVIYLIIKSNRPEDPIAEKIIAKLRQDAPQQKLDERLTSSQVVSRLKEDGELRRLISQNDFLILQQILGQRFARDIVVYAICAALFIAGVVLYIRSSAPPRPLALSDFHLESTAAAAKGLAVDLDTLRVEWKANGSPETIELFLENPQTSRRSSTVKVSSAEHAALWPPDSYKDLLEERSHGAYNRVIVVAKTADRVVQSKESRLYVGMVALALFNHETGKVCASVLIDNRAIQPYFFEARLLVYTHPPGRELVTFGERMQGPMSCYPIRSPKEYDWKTLTIAYFGPDDDRVIRDQVLVDEDAIAAKFGTPRPGSN